MAATEKLSNKGNSETYRLTIRTKYNKYCVFRSRGLRDKESWALFYLLKINIIHQRRQRARAHSWGKTRPNRSIEKGRFFCHIWEIGILWSSNQRWQEATGASKHTSLTRCPQALIGKQNINTWALFCRKWQAINIINRRRDLIMHTF